MCAELGRYPREALAAVLGALPLRVEVEQAPEVLAAEERLVLVGAVSGDEGHFVTHVQQVEDPVACRLWKGEGEKKQTRGDAEVRHA